MSPFISALSSHFFSWPFDSSNQGVNLKKGETIAIPFDRKQVLLSGAIPTPCQFIQQHKGMERSHLLHEVEHLTLNELLDVEKLKKMYRDMLTTCENYSHPYLIIASVPVAFNEVKDELQEQLPHVIESFISRIGNEIVSLIEEELKKMEKTFPVTIWIPSYDQLKHLPTSDNDQEGLTALVDGFPSLKMEQEKNKTLFILHNKGFSLFKLLEEAFFRVYSNVKKVKSVEFTQNAQLYDYKS